MHHFLVSQAASKRKPERPENAPARLEVIIQVKIMKYTLWYWKGSEGKNIVIGTDDTEEMKTSDIN